MNPTRAGVQPAIHHQQVSQKCHLGMQMKAYFSRGPARIVKLDTRLLPAKRTPA